jgi:two-component system, chemotaxis family, chemotaxis protein CheY
MPTDPFETSLKAVAVLIADGNGYMRRTARSMLMHLGVRSIRDVGDGLAALEQIRTWNPDVMLLDFDLPVVSGIELMRTIRSPGVFPRPDLPTIMLTSGISRSRAIETMKAGAHELLVKPISPKALLDRLKAVMINPRPLMRVGEYYVPKPRLPSPVSGLPE